MSADAILPNQIAKKRSVILWLLLAGALICFTPLDAASIKTEHANITIRIQSLNPPRLLIEGELNVPTQTWSFTKSYGGLLALGERIDGLALRDNNNAKVEVR